MLMLFKNTMNLIIKLLVDWPFRCWGKCRKTICKRWITNWIVTCL